MPEKSFFLVKGEVFPLTEGLLMGDPSCDPVRLRARAAAPDGSSGPPLPALAASVLILISPARRDCGCLLGSRFAAAPHCGKSLGSAQLIIAIISHGFLACGLPMVGRSPPAKNLPEQS